MNARFLSTASEWEECWRSCWQMDDLQQVLGAVAYVSDAGIAELVSCHSEAQFPEVTFICGAEGNSLKPLLDWQISTNNIACHFNLNRSGRFHPKIWLFRNSREAHLLVGSANLTRGGFHNNGEAGVHLSMNRGEKIEAEVRVAFESWLRNSRLITADVVTQIENSRAKREAVLATVADVLREMDVDSRVGLSNVFQDSPAPQPLSLPEIGVESRLINATRKGRIVSLENARRGLSSTLPAKFFGQERGSIRADLLELERFDACKVSFFDETFSKQLEQAARAARENLNRHAFDSPWGSFVPEAAILAWDLEQRAKRQKFDAVSRSLFADAAKLDEMRDRLPERVKKSCAVIWKRVNGGASEMPGARVTEVVAQVLDVFDSRRSQFSSDVALHYSTHRVGLADELSGEDADLAAEVAARLNEHAQAQKEYLLRDWMSCLVRRTREEVINTCAVLKEKDGVRKCQRQAKHLAKLNFYGDAELLRFTQFIADEPYLSADENQLAGMKMSQSPASYVMRAQQALKAVDMWPSLSYEDVLSSFAEIVGW